jgi:pimeloyl-ACP methyl ester carboxylesterase
MDRGIVGPLPSVIASPQSCLIVLAIGGERRQVDPEVTLRLPALLLAGASDFALSPRSLTGTGDHADDLTVRVISGAGHYLPEERPGLVAAAIREMASRGPGCRAG